MDYGDNMHNADAMRMTGVCIFAVAVVQVESQMREICILLTI